MPDGTVSYDEFEPALSFRVSDDWYRYVEAKSTDQVDQVYIDGPKGGQILFTNPLHVFDLSNPSEPKKLPEPENAEAWLSWFQNHPNLDTSKPVPVSVGGASGMQIDVAASSTLENYPRDLCSRQPCVPLYPTSGGPIIASPPDAEKDRYVIVDVGGQTVIINVFAPAGKFDAFSPKAQKVLDTVEWKSE